MLLKMGKTRLGTRLLTGVCDCNATCSPHQMPFIQPSEHLHFAPHDTLQAQISNLHRHLSIADIEAGIEPHAYKGQTPLLNLTYHESMRVDYKSCKQTIAVLSSFFTSISSINLGESTSSKIYVRSDDMLIGKTRDIWETVKASLAVV